MITIFPILAEGAPAGGGGGFGILPFILIMFAMMYFVMIRPQRKQQKAQEEMRNNLRKGDKVVSIGGIHGLITGTTDRTVSVKVADGLSLKFDKSAIASVIDSSKSAEPSNNEEEESSEEEKDA